jgi:hypothetical protein
MPAAILGESLVNITHSRVGQNRALARIALRPVQSMLAQPQFRHGPGVPLGGPVAIPHRDPEGPADGLPKLVEGEHDLLAPLDALAHQRTPWWPSTISPVINVTS